MNRKILISVEFHYHCCRCLCSPTEFVFVADEVLLLLISTDLVWIMKPIRILLLMTINRMSEVDYLAHWYKKRGCGGNSTIIHSRATFNRNTERLAEIAMWFQALLAGLALIDMQLTHSQQGGLNNQYAFSSESVSNLRFQSRRKWAHWEIGLSFTVVLF
jgi:hypothetical protein